MTDITKFPIPTRTFNLNDFNSKYAQTLTKASEAAASATAAADDAVATAADRTAVNADKIAAEAARDVAVDSQAPAFAVIDPAANLSEFKSSINLTPENGTLDAGVATATVDGETILQIADLTASANIVIATREWEELKPNTTYRFYFDARIVSATAIGSLQITKALWALDASGVNTGDGPATGQTLTADWQTITLDYTTDATPPVYLRGGLIRRSTYTDATGALQVRHMRIEDRTNGVRVSRRLKSIENLSLQEDAAPLPLAMAMSNQVSPLGAGTQDLITFTVSSAQWFIAQPFQPVSTMRASLNSPRIDLSKMIDGTVIHILSTSAQTWKLYSGSSSFAGRSGNEATISGGGYVTITMVNGTVCLSVGAGTVTFATISAPVASISIVHTGQSNEKNQHAHGGIGGFAHGCLDDIWMTKGTLDPSLRWIDGATGGTALMQQAVGVGETNYWLATDGTTNGPALTTCLTKITDAVDAGQPAPEIAFYTLGESDSPALDDGTITVAAYVAALKTVWGKIRQHCIDEGASDPILLVNEIGAFDSIGIRRVGISRIRQATAQAISETSYAYFAASNVDVPRVWGDIHYTSRAYYTLGRRRARAFYNAALDAWGQGAHDFSSAFPSGAHVGQHWEASVGGTIDSLEITVGDHVMCVQDASDTTADSALWRIVDAADTYDLGPVMTLDSTSADGTEITVSFTSGETLLLPFGTGRDGVSVGGAEPDEVNGAPGGFCVVKSDRSLIRILRVEWDDTNAKAKIVCAEDASGATVHFPAGYYPEHRNYDFVTDSQLDRYTRMPGLPCRSAAMAIS